MNRKGTRLSPEVAAVCDQGRVRRQRSPRDVSTRTTRLLAMGLARSLNGSVELRSVNRDVRLIFGEDIFLLTADPAKGVFERHHHAGDRTVIRVVDLRRNPADRRGGIMDDTVEQPGLLIEIKSGEHAIVAVRLKDVDVLF